MLSVLLIDDEDDIRTVVKLSLEHMGGMRVLTAASGAEGLVIAAREAPDLILVDLMMPDMDGRATFEALRADARTRDIPVVLVTARNQRRELESYLALGFAGVVVKPFDPMTLPREIRRIRDRSSPGNPDIAAALEELRAEYAVKLPQRCAELSRALDAALRGPEDDALAVAAERLAHKLRGTAGSLGFTRVAELCGTIERLFGAALEGRAGATSVRRSASPPPAPRPLGELEPEIRAAARALDELAEDPNRSS